MNTNQKLLLHGGIGLIIVSALIIASMTVPNTPTSALIFPLSILGFVFGVSFVGWSLGWVLLQKFKVLQ